MVEETSLLSPVFSSWRLSIWLTSSTNRLDLFDLITFWFGFEDSSSSSPTADWSSSAIMNSLLLNTCNHFERVFYKRFDSIEGLKQWDSRWNDKRIQVNHHLETLLIAHGRTIVVGHFHHILASSFVHPGESGKDKKQSRRNFEYFSKELTVVAALVEGLTLWCRVEICSSFSPIMSDAMLDKLFLNLVKLSAAVTGVATGLTLASAGLSAVKVLQMALSLSNWKTNEFSITHLIF